MGITVHTIVGNHTAYYKNTNDINAIDLLLREYDNIKIYSETRPITLGNLSVLLVPWINQENKDMTLSMINKTSSPVCMGHLELQGFKVNEHVVMDHGFDIKPFEKFTKVFSGHFHTRSTQDNISYLGNPYEIYWNDHEDTRGFHFFDTETLETTPVNNPYRLFYKVYYSDTDYQLFNASQLEDKIVKLIVRQKSDSKKFEKFIDKLYAANVAELKIVENFDFNGWYDKEDGDYESEDTMSILNQYIEESEINLDKSIIQKMMNEVYQEACELI
jgi:hypothetical protein